MNKFYQVFGVLVMVIVLMLFSFPNQALALDAGSSKELFKLGITHLESNKYIAAIENFSQAIEINPNYAKAYYNRCLAYLHSSDYQHAITDCNTAIEQNPQLFEAYLNRGLAYYT